MKLHFKSQILAYKFIKDKWVKSASKKVHKFDKRIKLINSNFDFWFQTNFLYCGIANSIYLFQ